MFFIPKSMFYNYIVSDLASIRTFCLNPKILVNISF